MLQDWRKLILQDKTWLILKQFCRLSENNRSNSCKIHLGGGIWQLKVYKYRWSEVNSQNNINNQPTNQRWSDQCSYIEGNYKRKEPTVELWPLSVAWLESSTNNSHYRDFGLDGLRTIWKRTKINQEKMNAAEPTVPGFQCKQKIRHYRNAGWLLYKGLEFPLTTVYKTSVSKIVDKWN